MAELGAGARWSVDIMGRSYAEVAQEERQQRSQLLTRLRAALTCTPQGGAVIVHLAGCDRITVPRSEVRTWMRLLEQGSVLPERIAILMTEFA